MIFNIFLKYVEHSMKYSFSDSLDLDSIRSTDRIEFICACGQKAEIEKRKFTVPLCRRCKLKKKREEGAYKNVSKNRKKTIIERYGSEEALNRILAEKRKKTNVEKYGVEHIFQTKQFKQKRKETLSQKYGSMENYEKHRLEKAENTFKENHSVSKGKFLHNAFVKKYGVENARDLPEVNEKIKSACLSKYGATSPLGNKKINEQCHKTFVEKYGVKSTLSMPETRKKIEKTMLVKYGVLYPGASPEIMRNRWAHYWYDGCNFDSSWELAYYIWLKDHNIDFEYHPNISFEFEYNNKQHYCIPDFRVQNEIIEIKGNQFLKDDKWINPFDENLNGLYEAKHWCLLKNNVKIITDCTQYISYVQEKYGKEFLMSCRNTTK